MKVSHKAILNEVCSHFKLTKPELFLNTRARAYSYPRHILFYLCRRYSPLTMTDIGDICKDYGKELPYDHATVRHGSVKIKNEMKFNKDMRTDVSDILDQIATKYDCKFSELNKKEMTETEILMSFEMNELKSRIDALENFIESLKGTDFIELKKVE